MIFLDTKDDVLEIESDTTGIFDIELGIVRVSSEILKYCFTRVDPCGYAVRERERGGGGLDNNEFGTTLGSCVR